MKSVVTIAKDRPFPKMMVSRTSGSVVLFRDNGYGVVLSSWDDRHIGTFCDYLDFSVFEDFDGSVTITQGGKEDDKFKD